MGWGKTSRHPRQVAGPQGCRLEQSAPTRGMQGERAWLHAAHTGPAGLSRLGRPGHSPRPTSRRKPAPPPPSPLRPLRCSRRLPPS